jgi:hypothetical protein
MGLSEESAGKDAPSEMDWLQADLAFLLGEIDELEEGGTEGDGVDAILRSIINALQELATLSNREEYREPDDVRAVADVLQAAALRTLSLIPRKRTRPQIPMIRVIEHLQDFRNAIATCVVVPADDKGE